MLGDMKIHHAVLSMVHRERWTDMEVTGAMLILIEKTKIGNVVLFEQW